MLYPGLQAKTLFEDLQHRFPGRFPDGQLRTLQRKIKAWRATDGPPEGGFLRSDPQARRVLAASDFTSLNDLQVTLAGQSFDHLVYHFVLTYSNWETGTVCFSEKFREPQPGAPERPLGTGRVPQTHRTDRLTAAVNNLGDRDLFQQRYLALMAHYGMAPQAIQAGKANQNGDAEQSHNRFKQAMDQAVMLCSGRDFADRAAYELFLRQVFARRNSGRIPRFTEERLLLPATSPRGGWTPGTGAGRGSPRGVRSGLAPTPTRCRADSSVNRSMSM